MIDFFRQEIRKIVKPLANKILIIFLLVFPVFALLVTFYSESGMQVSYQNQIVKGKEVRKLKDEIRTKVAGTIDEEWLDTLQLALLEPKQITKNSFEYQVLEDAYYDGLAAYLIQQDILKDSNLPEQIKKDYTSSVLYYGPYEDWTLYYQIFTACSFVYGIACLFLVNGVFNKEVENGTIDLIRSSKKGRIPITVIKIVSTLLVTVALGVGMLLVFVLITTACLDLSEMNATIVAYRKPQFMSYAQVRSFAFQLYFLGGVVMTFVGLLFSSFFSKMHQSFACGVLFVILPEIQFPAINTNWQMLFPSRFLMMDQSIVVTPWLQIAQYLDHFTTVIYKVWIPLIIVITIGIVYRECRYRKKAKIWK